MTRNLVDPHSVTDLLISPSEALLLGLCVGEYACYQKEPVSPPRRYFLDVFKLRIEPQIPTFCAIDVGPLDFHQLPDDVDWGSEGNSLGFARSAPNCIYVRAEGEFYYQRAVCPRRSLSDWIVAALSPYLSFGLGDYSVVGRDEQQFGPRLQQLWELVSTGRPLERIGGEVPDSIYRVIESIVHHNECQHVYDIGRRFGRLVYAIEDFEHFVWNLEEAKQYIIGDLAQAEFESREAAAEHAAEAQWKAWLDEQLQSRALMSAEARLGTEEAFKEEVKRIREVIYQEHLEPLGDPDLLNSWEPGAEFRPVREAAVREAAQELVDGDLVKQCHHANVLLRSLLAAENSPRFDTTDEPDLNNFLTAQLRTIPQVAYARMSVWLAFGEVLGVLRDADLDIRARDAEAMASRAFKLHPADSPDAVLQRLVKVEAELNADVDAIPEDLIARLAPSIDALAKRVWPQDFMPPGFRGELAAVFHGRLNSPNNLDRRFASIALSLHKAYRNPAHHQMDDFRCSFEEARFFLAGVRTLVDLWRQIREASRT